MMMLRDRRRRVQSVSSSSGVVGSEVGIFGRWGGGLASGIGVEELDWGHAVFCGLKGGAREM